MMINNILNWRRTIQVNEAETKLFDQASFYKVFSSDLRRATDEVVIESPFITLNRFNDLLPSFQSLCRRGIRVTVNTKHPDDYVLDDPMRFQALQAIEMMQELGVTVLLTARHHRKLAIIDRRITWEGSLNILSQYDSCELMVRLGSEHLASEMLRFVNLCKFI